jgi:predicted Rossmann fold flavoprotein
MGATRFGYKIAEQFGLPLVEPVPALVPLTFTDSALEPIKALSGVAVDTVVANERTAFAEPTLFTHRGLSGPGILQISTYWKPGEAITLDMAPGVDLIVSLKADRLDRPRLSPENWLAERLPKRLAAHIADGLPEARLADMSDAQIEGIALMVGAWRLVPAGSEGYRKAEVTRGGVNTDALSSKTMECRDIPGLYFIGEVVDVTGHLGGHNFQWAWASGVACGEVC